MKTRATGGAVDVGCGPPEPDTSLSRWQPTTSAPSARTQSVFIIIGRACCKCRTCSTSPGDSLPQSARGRCEAGSVARPQQLEGGDLDHFRGRAAEPAGVRHRDGECVGGRQDRDIGMRRVDRSFARGERTRRGIVDRKSTRLNSSHSQISYAVFCLKKKKYTSSDV